MLLSDVSVKRPVFACVISMLLLVFGLVSLDRLTLREYPDIDIPVVSIETNYRGASAAVVETRITRLLEDRLAGVEGLRSMASESMDGLSKITLEFTANTDIETAANDVRDYVSGALNNLPLEAESPTISKVDANADVIMWMNFAADNMTPLELTDYARRYLVDRYSALDGVARVRIGGELSYAMRIWVDRQALVARELSVGDIEQALREENVELPAGFIESQDRQYTVRVDRNYVTPEDFENLVLGQGSDGHLIRLRDVASVELAADQWRNMFRGNGVPMIGMGIVKQSAANTLDVSRVVREETARLNDTLPEGMKIHASYDTSVFIESAIGEVYQTLFVASLLVIAVILLFLRSWRATIIPAVTVPVALIGSFILLYFFGFSVNLLTLLALVLAVGLVVDDAIVVLENVYRHIESGSPPLLAAYEGTREVAFPVIATTMVLVAVFLPITFLEGQIGKLFAEFSITLTAAVIFSSFIALTLSPVLASFLLRAPADKRKKTQAPDTGSGGPFELLSLGYRRILERLIHRPMISIVVLVAFFAGISFAWQWLPSELTPPEDRGSFFLAVKAPQGTSFSYMSDRMLDIEERLAPLLESGEVQRSILRAPQSFDAPDFATARGVLVLSHWDTGRREAWEIMDEVRDLVSDIPGVSVVPIMRAGLGGDVGKPLQFVLGGPDYETLSEWRDLLVEKMAEYPGVRDFDHDFDETKPQVRVKIDSVRADDLGVAIRDIGETLETMLGSRAVTTFMDRGEEYDVILEAQAGEHRSPADLAQLQVRSKRSGDLVSLANLVSVEEFADAASLNRYNRSRAVTFDANIADGYSLGEALAYMEAVVAEELPPEAVINYKGQSLEFKEASSSTLLIFLLSIVVVYLVLAALFESFMHPLTIVMSVPFALCGALFALWATGNSINIYSQVAIIMLVGLAAKNGILIVEFSNQLRDRGLSLDDSILQASMQRLRPILMTGLTTAFGALPLILASGAGAETRSVIGWVVLGGIVLGTLLTLLLIPCLYRLLAVRTGSPSRRASQLAMEQKGKQAAGIPQAI
ncbi:MAG: efflux RND transporter permease subunit [Pseudomonadota bacterium]